MQINILAFGIARDIVGGRELPFTIEEGTTVAQLRQRLTDRFPEFGRLASLAIAVNGAYAEEELELTPRDEVVIIPPVSGG